MYQICNSTMTYQTYSCLSASSLNQGQVSNCTACTNGISSNGMCIGSYQPIVTNQVIYILGVCKTFLTISSLGWDVYFEQTVAPKLYTLLTVFACAYMLYMCFLESTQSSVLRIHHCPSSDRRYSHSLNPVYSVVVVVVSAFYRSLTALQSITYHQKSLQSGLLFCLQQVQEGSTLFSATSALQSASE